uniref:NADH-ubiquinone oxidoreductase chain 2 n=1 Tax=Pilsbryoconcha exilis TaxID=178825 RepID=A0A513X0J1_9BIVA|nr:NADH dehydrogenase subunit 2 [Pilsbryoconcha exilis]
MLTIILIVSTLMTFMSTNTLFTWMMLELNMLSFIPLMHTKNLTTETEASMKYTIPQSFGSSLFMMSTLMMPLTQSSKLLASTALILKLGGVPLHTWFPTVMELISPMTALILTTWQKMAPLLLLTTNELAYTPMIVLSAIASALWGSTAGLNQTNLLKLMTFSSINHLSWLLMSSMLNSVTPIIYMASYSLTVLPIFLYMQTPNSTSYKTTLFPSLNNFHQLSFILSALSLASLPPLTMFLNKLPIITMMLTELLTPLLILLLSAAVSLYFYLSLAIMMMLNFNTSPKMRMSENIPAIKSILYTVSAVFQMAALPLWCTTQIF